MLANLRAFLAAMILTSIFGSLALHLPPFVSLLRAVAAAIFVASPIIWIILDAAGPLKGRLASAAAHLGGWVLAPVFGSFGQVLFALPATLLWPIGNLFDTPILTGDIWSWAPRTFLAAVLVMLYWAVERLLILRTQDSAIRTEVPVVPQARSVAPEAPIRITPFRVGPTPTEREIVRRLDALQSAVAHLSDQTSDGASRCASDDLRATVQLSQALDQEAPAAVDQRAQGEEASDADAPKPQRPGRPGKDAGRTNILDLFHRRVPPNGG